MSAHKKIWIIFHGRFPSEKAASLFAAKSAEVFAEEGLLVTLIVPKRNGAVEKSIKDFYGINENFTVTYQPTIDLFPTFVPNSIAFWLSIIAFSFSSAVFLKKHANKSDIIYSNELLPLAAASLFFKNTFYEMHDFPESKKKIFAGLIKKVRWVLIHNHWKTEMAKSELSIPANKIITVPNAVSIIDFDIILSKDEARKKLGLPPKQPIVIYTGHLYSWKGVDTLAQVALILPSVLFVFVGGTEGDINRFKAKYQVENIVYTGFQRHATIPVWQKAADVLVIPNTAKEDISKYYTSPMKLFEYMASGVPIVASKIPSIEEIVSSNEVKFVSPDDVQDLRDGIEWVIKNSSAATALAAAARKKVEDFTWQSRARKILEFISK